MAIDPIGKKGPAGIAGEPAADPATLRRTDAAEPFRPAAPTVQVPSVQGDPSALDRLRSGSVSFEGYLDLKVDEASAHLGPMSPTQLEAVRRALRDRLATDPTLVDLVKTSTGRVARATDED
ncbi:MAG TPA: hypothetical protein VKU41_26335 [Polyangiaceae bacterium]|nr:hypothetical protein [Polyangiaceae bacterium]